MPKQVKSKAKPRPYYIIKWIIYYSAEDRREIKWKGVVGEKEMKKEVGNMVDESGDIGCVTVYKVIEVGKTVLDIKWNKKFN